MNNHLNKSQKELEDKFSSERKKEIKENNEILEKK